MQNLKNINLFDILVYILNYILIIYLRNIILDMTVLMNDLIYTELYPDCLIKIFS